MDQQCLFRFKVAKGKYVVPNRQQCLGECGTLASINLGRQLQRMVRSSDGDCGVTAALHQCSHTIAYLKPLNISAYSCDLPRNLKA